MEHNLNKLLQYQVLVSIVEEGSLSAAGRALNVSPSAISKQLTALEDSLNSKLIERTNKLTRPTGIGSQFYERCKLILNSVEEAEKSIAPDDGVTSGSISITLSKSLIRSKVFDVISDFQKLYPLVKYNFIFSDQVQDLAQKNIDIAFRLGDLGDSSRIYAKYLMDTKLICCATPEYILKNGNTNSINELKSKSVILPEPKNLSTELRKFFQKNSLNLDYEKWHNSNDIEGVYQGINSGLAAGFLLDISIVDEIDNGKFIDILTNSTLPKKKLHLLHKKKGHSSKIINLFIDHVLKAFR